MKSSLLITKSIAELNLLPSFCEANDVELIGQSFIDFEQIDSPIPNDIQVLFFGSKRAAHFFLAQSKIPTNYQVACIGETTKLQLEIMGIQVDFWGSEAGNPEVVAEELKIWLVGRKLHIALSDVSNRSMSKILPKEQVVEIQVYKTVQQAIKINSNPTILAFTSPSNLSGYLLKNTIPKNTHLIVWGKTTEMALNNLGFQADYVLTYSTEKELVEYLESYVNH
jgi:uroporphyrinogen-III synthase